MKLTILLLALFAAASVTACRTSRSEAKLEDDEIPCTCGAPDALFDGCANPICVSGHNNPSNPNCVCGDLRIGPANGK
jgi:hypothetical protein